MSKPTHATSSPASVTFVYRVHPVTIRDGQRILPAYWIQARELGKRTWMSVNIGGRDCRYLDREKANRHCRWLMDPHGMEPDWGSDESPEAPIQDANRSVSVDNT